STSPHPIVIMAAVAGLHAQTNPVPLINSPLVPDSATPGGSAFDLTVNGAGFISNWVVAAATGVRGAPTRRIPRTGRGACAWPSAQHQTQTSERPKSFPSKRLAENDSKAQHGHWYVT